MIKASLGVIWKLNLKGLILSYLQCSKNCKRVNLFYLLRVFCSKSDVNLTACPKPVVVDLDTFPLIQDQLK